MDSLSNHFLIAMPALADPNFERTVTLVCQHDEAGALGVVVNRMGELSMGDVLRQLKLVPDTEVVMARRAEDPVYIGGPVQTELGLILHDGKDAWTSTIDVADGISLTTSLDVLEAVAKDEGPERTMLVLGYAGWGPGQLEQEMIQNAWLSVAADPEIVFDTPSEMRWQAAASAMGVDLALLSGQTGRA